MYLGLLVEQSFIQEVIGELLGILYSLVIIVVVFDLVEFYISISQFWVFLFFVFFVIFVFLNFVYIGVSMIYFQVEQLILKDWGELRVDCE